VEACRKTSGKEYRGSSINYATGKNPSATPRGANEIQKFTCYSSKRDEVCEKFGRRLRTASSASDVSLALENDSRLRWNSLKTVSNLSPTFSTIPLETLTVDSVYILSLLLCMLFRALIEKVMSTTKLEKR
jgi:hypothetical protein